MNPPTLHDFRFTVSGRAEQKSGLLGWIAFTVEGHFRVDGITLRRTVDGRFTLGFPTRVSRDGMKRPVVWPPTDEARIAIEAQVFSSLHISADA